MENQSQQKGKPSLIAKIVTVAVVLLVIVLVQKIFFGDLFGNKSTEAAEKYVNQKVYESLGLTCERYDTETIYKDGDVRLIAVKFYFKDSSAAGGSFCVYCGSGYVRGSTKMMGAAYDYNAHIDELKALFGI